MSLRLAPNLNTMYTEFDFLSRFQEAKKDGFNYIELQNPYWYSPEDLKEARSGTKCVLLNTHSAPGKYGYAATPFEGLRFYYTLCKIASHCQLGVQKVHIMSGLRDPRFSVEDQLKVFVHNLDVIEKFMILHSFMGVIEPICEDVIPNYFLNSYELALEVLRRTKNRRIKLLLDVYHLKKITGDVEKYLPLYYPYASHIQVSQDPDRREPFYPGTIDYEYVFNFLLSRKYKGYVGLEYFPSGSTRDSLIPLKKYM